MELEFWSELSAAVSAVSLDIPRRSGDLYSTALIVRVHLWSVLHDRPTCWACERRNWNPRTRPAGLPDQSTMSRRMRREDFMPFLQRMGERLNGRIKTVWVKVIDGKPLELPNHTSDPDAAWGRGVSRTSVGYKLHAVFSGNPMPDALAITPLNVCEKQMAGRMVKRLGGGGYLLGDAHYDASWLHDWCHAHHHQLLCPRAKPGTGIGHHYNSPHRRRAIDLLEMPRTINRFGPDLYQQRTAIERDFSQMSCFGSGLSGLPTWVRRIWRVRNWVMAKLLINAARIRINRTDAVGA